MGGLLLLHGCSRGPIPGDGRQPVPARRRDRCHVAHAWRRAPLRCHSSTRNSSSGDEFGHQCAWPGRQCRAAGGSSKDQRGSWLAPELRAGRRQCLLWPAQLGLWSRPGRGRSSRRERKRGGVQTLASTRNGGSTSSCGGVHRRRHSLPAMQEVGEAQPQGRLGCWCQAATDSSGDIDQECGNQPSRWGPGGNGHRRTPFASA
mmetsp:Transcript_130762/g.406617  ORF Transcript_130762/g.406617 Transcript_130762/m.406617 type:complete len:203 (+) Transcript_130762:1222-1830(+)